MINVEGCEMKENVVQERSFEFALTIIELYKLLVEKREYVLSKQLLRAGTSIGANVEEGIAAQSRKDFLSKISIAAKEARETRYWLRLLEKSRIIDIDYTDNLNDVERLIKILTSIVKTTSESLSLNKHP